MSFVIHSHLYILLNLNMYGAKEVGCGDMKISSSDPWCEVAFQHTEMLCCHYSFPNAFWFFASMAASKLLRLN